MIAKAMFRICCLMFFGICLVLSWGGVAVAASGDTPARQAIMIDFATGTVLLEKEPDQRMPPSSMSKLMTIYMLFERLAEGRLKLTDTFTVSKKAWKMGGSKMFVEVGKQVSVEDLIRGIVVQSGNDACIVVAEGLAGDEAAFAQEMNQRAEKLGLKDSHFVNSSGWPDPDHYVTARDLALLARRLIKDFPQYYAYFKEKTFTYNKIKQGNRNPLLYRNVSADGLKTGHTEAAGYGLVGSAKRGDQRLILVVNGLKSVNQRSRETERLINWGFREFGTYKLFGAGEVVSDAGVWLGENETVPLVLPDGLAVVMSRKARKEMKVSVNYRGPIAAPISKGQQVATLRVTAPNFETVERPLLAGQDVPRLGPFNRLFAAVKQLVLGGIPQ
jgi:D-alanyl-D-alanine carboxypeptidase (penicillin-binding protein 5/6)